MTDITSYKAMVAARFLKAGYPGIKIVATDHRPFARWVHSRYVDRIVVTPVAPETGLPYVEALRDVLVDCDADLLLPMNSSEIRHLMDYKERLGRPFAYVGTPGDYLTLDNKHEFSRLLAGMGLPHPRQHATLNVAPPLVLKPRRGSSARGIRYLLSEADVAEARERYADTIDEYIIQDYIVGEGVGYSGYFENGRILVGYAHRRVAEYPSSGGSSVVRQAYPYDDAQRLQDLVEAVLAKVPWSGFAMFEFKRSAEGMIVFIECNPRIWGSIHQGLASGVNYFEPLLGVAAQIEGRPYIRTELFPLSWISFIGYLFLGKASIIGEVMRGWPHTRYDVHPLRDPLGFASLLMRRA